MIRRKPAPELDPGVDTASPKKILPLKEKQSGID